MGWTKGRPRPKKANLLTAESENAPSAAVDEPVALAQEPSLPVEESEAPQSIETPADWTKGALLNVRNHGEHYIITLYPEEYSRDREERCIKFTNVGRCQDFVSDWYARQSHDPRAR